MLAELRRRAIPLAGPSLQAASPHPASIVEARDVWFSYDARQPTLRGASLCVRAGELTMLFGRSGSGKTTLLKLIRGLLQPQSGAISFGAPIVDGEAGSRIAYIPQTLGLVRSVSALDNALTGALGRTGQLRSLARSFPKPVVEDARTVLASLGIGHKADVPVYRLSGGERQRVAIARALMQQPQLILADEFVSQLDPITAEEIMRMMKTVAAAGVALLVTTHETDSVAPWADQIAVMAEGRIVHQSPGREVRAAQILELLA